MNDWNNQQDDPWAAPQQPSRPESGGGFYDSGLPRSTNGTTVLILGLISWFMCGIFTAVPGWAIARSDRALIKAGQMEPDSTLEVGYWLNVAVLGLTLVGFFLFFVAMMFGIVAGAAGSVQ